MLKKLLITSLSLSLLLPTHLSPLDKSDSSCHADRSCRKSMADFFLGSLSYKENKGHRKDIILKALIDKDIKKLGMIKFNPNESLLLNMPSSTTSPAYVPYLGIVCLLACMEEHDTGSVSSQSDLIIRNLLKRGAFPGAVMVSANGKALASISELTGFAICPVYKIIKAELQKKYKKTSFSTEKLATDTIKYQTDVAPLIKKYLKSQKKALNRSKHTSASLLK